MTDAARKPATIVAATMLAGLLAASMLGVGLTGVASAATCDTSWLGGDGNWNDAGNWSSGVPGGGKPNACITADGTYTVSIVARTGNHATGGVVPGELTLGGNSGTQTVAVTGTEVDALPFPTSLSVGQGTINPHGALVFSSSVASLESNLCAGEPGLVNQGTISFEPGAGGGRTIQGKLENEGTVDVNADTVVPSSHPCGGNRLANAGGTIEIAAGKTLTDTEEFSQDSGTTNVSGSLSLTNGIYEFTGGAVTGNKPVLTNPLTFSPSGGSGAFVIHGSADFVSDVGKDITLVVEGTGSENASLNAGVEADHATNRGTIMLTSTAASSAELSAYDHSTPNSLTNTGTIEVLTGAGGERLLSQAITNADPGTISVNADTKGSFLQIANSGTLDVAAATTFSSVEALAQSAGATVVNGALATNQPLTIQGGSLRGAGTVTAPTVSNTGGTVHPGNSPGLLTIAGNYVQGPSGTLAAEIAGGTPGSGYSRLAVSGDAAIDGTLDLTNGFTPAAGQAFQVLTGGGTLSGAFASTAVHGEPGYDVQYNPSDVTLVAHALPPQPPATGGGSTGSGPPSPVSDGKKAEKAPSRPKIVKGPSPKTTKTTAKFSFSAGHASSFKCKLDKRSFTTCRSPVKYRGLKPGQHTFQVRGVNRGGKAGAIKKFKWRVAK